MDREFGVYLFHDIEEEQEETHSLWIKSTCTTVSYIDHFFHYNSIFIFNYDGLIIFRITNYVNGANGCLLSLELVLKHEMW